MATTATPAVSMLHPLRRLAGMYTTYNCGMFIAHMYHAFPSAALQLLRANSSIIATFMLAYQARHGFGALPHQVLTSLLPPAAVARCTPAVLTMLAALMDLLTHHLPAALLGLPAAAAWWAFPGAAGALTLWYGVVQRTVGLHAVYLGGMFDGDLEFVHGAVTRALPVLVAGVVFLRLLVDRGLRTPVIARWRRRWRWRWLRHL